jgi:membrane-bound ClpP family serine protease
MKFQDLMFLLLLASIALFLLAPDFSSFVALLVIILAAFIVYLGPYEAKKPSESAGYALIFLGIMLFIVEKLMGYKFLIEILGLSPSDIGSRILVEMAPIVSILAGFYIVIDNEIKKEILGEKKS